MSGKGAINNRNTVRMVLSSVAEHTGSFRKLGCGKMGGTKQTPS